MHAMTDEARFWDKTARKYAQSAIRDPAAYEATLDRVRSYLRSDQNVLEIGCGTASTALLLAPHVAHITASDVSPEMIEIGREKIWDQSVRNVTPVAGQIGAPGLDGRYDVILAFNLLHLLTDLDTTLAQVHAQLHPGGLFISKSPCLGDKKRWLKPVITLMQWLGKAPYVTFFSRATLRAQIEAAGFEIIETADLPPTMPSHFIVARRPA
ncbi:class I SAM-dependent methyltransferase [Gymnodinialimonas sp. 2305UL16-5]|uniref:class I SAM-dependent DNA methyltransferase n=1 Tax=Gymnodinialimonas mytili TaxID=3126503 RepID=UPI0030A8840A